MKPRLASWRYILQNKSLNLSVKPDNITVPSVITEHEVIEDPSELVEEIIGVLLQNLKDKVQALEDEVKQLKFDDDLVKQRENRITQMMGVMES